MSQFELFWIENPCVGICQSAKNGYCIGCLRSRQERFDWHSMADSEKHRVLGLIAGRQKKLSKLKQQKNLIQLSVFIEEFTQEEFEQFDTLL